MATSSPSIIPKSTLSTTELSDLRHLSSLLHLAHHRNRNQHRRAPFYRYFLLFRRHLSRIIDLYTTLAYVPDTHTARHRKKAEDRAALARVQGEVDFLARTLVPRCEHAFGQLIADLRFGVLGVMLIGALAQSCGILGINAWYDDVAEQEVGEVLRQFEREEWGTVKGGAEVEDLGEVVKRERSPAAEESGTDRLASEKRVNAHSVGIVQRVPPEPLDRKKHTTKKTVKERPANFEPVKEKKKKKKRKGGGDDIDDLFDGL
ncbi:hypothetical protein K461DRAFT_290420 [Myriangium duriaei CBS 260.36]|uniref:RNase MRP protein 1 RNA binding domain-containing protein n=1 Tax=Myriangium duriaei CBS 260.36 TaxID=1168546 RepID=A0A9P4MKE7_9PEZI|nr:hypothetical protein K461DRAFT_290420 [Myriangium duriaei CBS 260.36]